MDSKSVGANQTTEEVDGLQEEFDVGQIARVDALTDDIKRVIDESTPVQSYDHVAGEVADYRRTDGTVYFTPNLLQKSEYTILAGYESIASPERFATNSLMIRSSARWRRPLAAPLVTSNDSAISVSVHCRGVS